MVRSFWALLTTGVVIVVAISLLISQNLKYAPDESSHLKAVSQVADEGLLLSDEGWQGTPFFGHSYYLYSPVPYLPYVPFALALDSGGKGQAFNEVYNNRELVRLAGPIYAVLQILATWWLLSAFKLPRAWCLTLTILVNALPQLRVLHAYVNADSYTIVVATFASGLALRYLQSRTRLGLAELGLAGLVLLALSHGKISAWPLALVIPVALGLKWLRNDRRVLSALTALAVPAAIVALGAGWLFLHNWLALANGGLLAGQDHRELMNLMTFGSAYRPVLSLIDQVKHLCGIGLSMLIPVGQLSLRDILLTAPYLILVSFGGLRILAIAKHEEDHVRGQSLALGLLFLLGTVIFILMSQPGLRIWGRILLPFFIPLLSIALALTVRFEPRKAWRYGFPSLLAVLTLLMGLSYANLDF